MATKSSAFLLFLLCLIVGGGLATNGKFEDLQPRKPREAFRSQGGRIEVWDPSEFTALCDAQVGVKKLTLEPQGLGLPSYNDAPMLKIITKGSAKVGISNPGSDKAVERNIVFRVRKGDVIALPRGTASWIYNDGNERTEILEVGDTSGSSQCGQFKVFHLAGGKQEEKYSSVLQGFSKDLLAHAFDVDEGTVQEIRQAQKGVAIIKLDDKQRMSLPDYYSINTLFMDSIYRLGDAQPDVKVRDGGELRLLNSLKLPVLRRHLNMAVACVKLESGAMTAPGWIHNAHNVLYVEGGRGRVQVVRDNGEQALDAEVEEGSLIVIPANYPSVKLAGDEGFRYIGVLTNHMPVESFLAGRNSVYKGMPSQVVSSAFQIDASLHQKLAERRTEEAYIFPPSHRRRRQSRPSAMLFV